MEEAYDVAVEALALARKLHGPHYQIEAWRQLIETLEQLVAMLAP